MALFLDLGNWVHKQFIIGILLIAKQDIGSKIQKITSTKVLKYRLTTNGDKKKISPQSRITG